MAGGLNMRKGALSWISALAALLQPASNICFLGTPLDEP